MKQFKWIFIMLVLLAMVLVACGGDDEPDAPEEQPAEVEEEAETEEAADEEEEVADETDTEEMAEEPSGVSNGLDKDLSGITIRMANIGGAPYEAMYDAASQFEEATGATVEIVFLGDGFEIDRYLKTNYAADTVDFDVAWNHTSFMSQFTNFVEPLQNWFSEEALAAFSPAIIDAATIDGDLQLIPRHADISSMHYRTDLFEDADLQAAFESAYGYPLAPPETLEQMYEMAEFFVSEGVIQYGTQFAGKEEALAGRFYEVLVANGGNYFDQNLTPIFDSEAGQMSAQWMLDLYENDLIPADTPNLLWPEVAQNFCDGNVAFYLEWYGWYSYFQDPESCEVAGKFDMVRGPVGAGDDHTGWAGAHAFSVTKASQNKEAAAQLVKYFTSFDVSYEEGKLGVLPVRDDVWTQVIADAEASDVPLDKTRLEVAQTQIGEDFFTPPLFADWISFTNTWYPTLQGIILGDMSVEEGLAQGVADTAQLLTDLGYENEQLAVLTSPDIGAGAGETELEGEAMLAGVDKDLSGVTLRMANIGGAPYEAMYDSISRFEEATGATVEIVFLGDGFEIDRYLKTNYAADTVDFDVAWNHTSFMSQFTNFVEPLQNWFSEEELAAFSPAIIESATIDGDLQLIPRHADISSMHYRTDLFEDADLQAAFESAYGYPLATPETLDQMYDMAEFFVGDGVIQYGTQFAGKEEALAGRFYEVLVANGGNYFDADFNPIFDSEAGQISAQWMLDLYDNGLIPADTPNLLWPEVAQNFCDGNVAFYLEWYGWYSYFQDPESCEVEGKFGIVRGPIGAGDDHTGWAGAHAFSIPLASENKEAAVQLVKFFTSEAISYEEAMLGVLPVRDDVWTQVIADAAASDVALDKVRLEVANTQISEDFFTPPLFADWISFTDLWFPTLQGVFLGDMSVEEGLAQGVADTAQLLTDLGYENEQLAVLTSPDIGAGAGDADVSGEAMLAGVDKDLSGVTLRMANIGGAPYEAMYDSISRFEEATGATVEIIFLGDGFEIDRYLKTNYAADTVDFDVAWNHTSFMSQFTNFVEPLQNWFSEEELAAFSPAIIESATLDGNLQLIPRHADISGMHYRTDLFEDADLQAAFESAYGYPLLPPETLDQMYDMAEFFVGEGVIQYGTEFAGKEEALAGRFYEVLVANGGNYFDADFNPIFDSEAGQMSAQWMLDLYDNGLIPADTPNLLWPEVAQNFCDGNVAFYLEWYGWYSYFQDPESCEVAGKFGIVRGPIGAGDDHTGWAGAHAFSIPLDSENKEAAAELVKFLTSEAISYEEGKLGVLPVRDDVWARVIADAGESDVPLDKVRLEVANTQIAEDFFTPPLFQDWISFTDLWFPILQGIFLGDTTVEEGLEQGVSDAFDLLDSFGYYE